MPDLDSREITIINAIHRNHKRLLENQMVTHFGVYFEQSEHPEKIYSWIEKIEDTRLLANHYLETIAVSRAPSSLSSLEKDTSGINYYFDKAKLLLPETIRGFLFDPQPQADSNSLFNFITAQLFSLALGNTITDVLFDYFNTQFTGTPEDAEKQFKDLLEKQTELSNLIKKECERISVELIKLFHFREMLILGKISPNPIEPNAREEFISRARISNQANETINIAIEVYFARELTKIFNTGFQSLYRVHDVEIKSELQSPVVKWINQLSESEKIRLAFSQEIQLKFMLMTRDFLLEKMNEKGILARYPIVFSLMAGFIVAPVIGITLAIVMGGALIWGIAAIALLGASLAAIGTHLLINKISSLTYKRNNENRTHIQESINMINNEFLRLKKEMVNKKETSPDVIESTKDFGKVNQTFIRSLEGKKVARGSISGWLREYASRYRHSKAIEVDLGDEYKHLISQSRIQSQKLIESINNKESRLLKHWIEGTMAYLKKDSHQELIRDFELIQKIKEQVLEIVGQVNYIPPGLLEFYCAPANIGGLAGNESDFAHIKRLVPVWNNKNSRENPYNYLCDTALSLFKKFEPRYASDHMFFGDPEYRQMLGIARGDHGGPVTSENIDLYLKNSYAFLLSLCNKIKPGLGLDPLQQTARVSDEFILYKMLLLKQLATLSETNNKEINNEIKLKIKKFIQKHFNQDTQVIFDDLSNQIFLLNKDVQASLTYKNSEQFSVIDVELENIIQAITLDVAYSSMNFKLRDVLNYYINDFLQHHSTASTEIFAYNTTEQELNPQGTQQFARIIKQYCANTIAFLEASRNNKALTATNILDCYKYNVSLQVYRTQLRIINNLKDINKSKIDSKTNEEMDILLKTFKHLSEFAKTNCFALKQSSMCSKLFNFINSKTVQSSKNRDWLKHIDSKEALIDMMDNLPNQLELPENSYSPKRFFSIKPVVTGEELSSGKVVSHTAAI